MTIPCIQTENIALLTKTTKDMTDKIEKLDSKVDGLNVKLTDFMSTITLSVQKNNNDINQAIQQGFADIRLNFEKERVQTIENTKERAKRNFASKLVEKAVYTSIWIICTTALIAMLALVINK